MSSDACVLCADLGRKTNIVDKKGRRYLHCHHCELIFVDRFFLPDLDTEFRRYQHHQNGDTNLGYIQFLHQMIKPSLSLLKSGMNILDFGCGPTNTLAKELEKEGYNCSLYDPYFYPSWPSSKFDFIFSTEVFEHFHHPKLELQKVINLLHDGGYLAVMTEFRQNIIDFENWYYIRDNTHVCFYHELTMNYIADTYNLSVIYSDLKRCVIFQKQ